MNNKTYYILVIYSHEFKCWEMEHGEHTRKDILEEAECYPGQRKKIIRCRSDQKSIDVAIAALNRSA